MPGDFPSSWKGRLRGNPPPPSPGTFQKRNPQLEGPTRNRQLVTPPPPSAGVQSGRPARKALKARGRGRCRLEGPGGSGSGPAPAAHAPPRLLTPRPGPAPAPPPGRPRPGPGHARRPKFPLASRHYVSLSLGPCYWGFSVIASPGALSRYLQQ
ncbi:formin-like protein 20 [Camelus ferus]|uniref:Formin-like protein 20 n=1 Tax=Camelus ferus TaxID=419612 RepID=A0A8B8SRZ9_CAMFR|nr:formin-like protein 20 [Camelus ferus]